MEINLTPEEEGLVRHSVETGRLTSPEAAFHEAMSLWVDQERKRIELLSALKEAEASLARGEGIELTEDSMKQLVADISRRGKESLEARKSSGN